MKKVLLVLMLLLAFCAPAFAGADIVINNVSATVVRDKIIAGMKANQGHYPLQEQTENTLKFVETTEINNDKFKGFAKDEVTFTLTPGGNDTAVSVSQVIHLYESNGTLRESRVPENKAGLKTGDVLLSVNNILTKDIPQEAVQSYEFTDMFSGSPATLVISRNGEQQTYTVTPQFYGPKAS